MILFCFRREITFLLTIAYYYYWLKDFWRWNRKYSDFFFSTHVVSVFVIFVLFCYDLHDLKSLIGKRCQWAQLHPRCNLFRLPVLCLFRYILFTCVARNILQLEYCLHMATFGNEWSLHDLYSYRILAPLHLKLEYYLHVTAQCLRTYLGLTIWDPKEKLE